MSDSFPECRGGNVEVLSRSLSYLGHFGDDETKCHNAKSCGYHSSTCDQLSEDLFLVNQQWNEGKLSLNWEVLKRGHFPSWF
jgi:hypothetical protein